MTTRDTFRALWAERRHWPRGSVDHDYLTRALRKLAWIIRGVPADKWETMT